MDQWEMECLDCGWRGMVAELTEGTDGSGGRSPGSCPDCGGSEFAKRTGKDE